MGGVAQFMGAVGCCLGFAVHAGRTVHGVVWVQESRGHGSEESRQGWRRMLHRLRRANVDVVRGLLGQHYAWDGLGLLQVMELSD
jgi:hypothetical protein